MLMGSLYCGGFVGKPTKPVLVGEACTPFMVPLDRLQKLPLRKPASVVNVTTHVVNVSGTDED